MILNVRLRDFKNVRQAKLRLGPFTLLVGTNASGKSNLRDACRFLHGNGCLRSAVCRACVAGKSNLL